MGTPRPVVLIAAPASVIQKLKAGVADRVEVLGAETHEEAIACLEARRVDLLVVCYVFDDAHPYRLLNHVEDLGERPDAMLVRALPVPLREDEREVRSSYAQLGVREFQNFSDQEKSEGPEAALARFRQVVLSLLPG